MARRDGNVTLGWHLLLESQYEPLNVSGWSTDGTRYEIVEVSPGMTKERYEELLLQWSARRREGTVTT